MNRKVAIIVGLQAFLIVMLFWVLVFYGKDEYEALTQESEEEIETPNRISEKLGTTVITINQQTQVQSEINTQPLEASSYLKSISSYGSVLSIDQLIDLRTRYLAAKAEADVLIATLGNSRHEYGRLVELNKDDKNISDKAVATSLSGIKTDEARLIAAEANARNIADSMRQTWGEVLTKHATERHPSALLQSLISYQEVLLQITLPFDATEPTANSTITVSPTAAPSHSIKAYYLSRAPVSNLTIQGKTFFYHAKTPDLRAGMQVNALSPQSKNNIQGVVIPNSAVVWYGGKPWVYRKTDKEHFSRLPINTDVELENGWFYKGNLKPNDLIVTSGAQLLLSEEFKYQITNENED